MKEKFLEKLDIISNFSTPGLEDDEIGSFLTDAEFNFVKNILPPKEMVDATELLRAELGTLYSHKEVEVSSSQEDTEENGKYWDLPSDCFYVLKTSAIMSSDRSCLNNKRVKCKPVTYDSFDENLDNPFKNPYRGLVWVLQGKAGENGVRRLQTIISKDYTDIAKFKISYIKKPQGILPSDIPDDVVNSILPDITHQEIVDNAVEQAKLQLGLLNEYQAQNAYNEENK